MYDVYININSINFLRMNQYNNSTEINIFFLFVKKLQSYIKYLGQIFFLLHDT